MRKKMLLRYRARLSLALVFVAGVALAQQSPQRFATPRQAAYNFLQFQQPESYRPEIAAGAFPDSLPLAERIELARKLKATLDGRGFYIDLDALPNRADYVDSLSGAPEVTLHKQLPQVVLRKSGERWVFAQETIDAIPLLYSQTVSPLVEHLIDRLPASLKAQYFGIALWQMIGVFVILLFGLVIRKIAEYMLSGVVHRLTKKTNITWDEKIVALSDKPVSLFLMAAWFMVAYPNLQFSVTTNAVVRVACEVLLYFSVLWLLYRLVDLLEFYLGGITEKTESKLDDQLVPLLRKTLKVFIVVIGTIFVLQNLEINVTSLLTGLGLGGLAFALAARDTLANFFGSITIFVDKPFQVGDWVVYGNYEGTVEEVGFRSTRIRTFYNSVVSVPNAKITDTALDNMGMRQYRRVKTTLGLTYSTTPEQMQAFVEGIRGIILANPHTRKDYYEIHFYNYGAHSLDVLVYFFVKVGSWTQELTQRHYIFLEILRLAKEVGVEFAFPTQTVHIDSFYRDLPREVGKPLPPDALARVVQSFGPGGAQARPAGPVLSHNGQRVDFTAVAAASKAGSGE